MKNKQIRPELGRFPFVQTSCTKCVGVQPSLASHCALGLSFPSSKVVIGYTV